jgi:hypothetical protein
MTLLIGALVSFCCLVAFFWVGVSVVVYVRLGEAQMKTTRKGRLMVRTAYGALAVAGCVIAAAVARWIVAMLGV